ncbi:phospholipase D-like domain-containing protein [Azohydromonas sediminis]|uniref:phospholipase D-like domain-containing protein n=1 Tax=Azohydromonas sediminis TaxID=2259674 RepID=UPI000E64AF6B|nr:phospholipase D-like domain-containing protein [Azohydromonas sediminis]
MSAFDTLAARIERPDGVRRLGQALWMLAGERVESPAALLWSRSAVGADGEEVLWRALLERGCLDDSRTLLPRPLADFLRLLWGKTEPDATLLWTLPEGLQVPGVDPSGYVSTVLGLIRQARERLLLVAPFMEAKGVGRLQDEVLSALNRGVAVTFVTQDAAIANSWASESLESLRREARGLAGRLRVYAASADLGVLLHSKLVVSDGATASVGSANLTGNAMAKNLETGVAVGATKATELEHVVSRLIEAGYVTLAFDTKAVEQ